jgi:hypothetical protein
MKEMREGMGVLVLQIVLRRSAVRVASHPHHDQEPYRLPHQGLWFALLLIGLLLLLGKNVAAI